MKKSSCFTVVTILAVFCFLYIGDFKFNNKYPTPTEFIQKKKDKKKYKKDREQWIENMHKAAPGIDWKSIDQENRKINTNN